MGNAHHGHRHETEEQELLCSVLSGLYETTGLACAAVIVERAEDGAGAPFAAFRGNVTDLALMVRTLIEVTVRTGRPTSCVACMENFDALMRAREAMARVVGSC